MEQHGINTDILIFQNVILDTISSITGIQRKDISSNTPFSELGIESLTVMEFNTRIGSYFPGIIKTLLFDRKSAADLCDYLVQHHPDGIASFVSANAPPGASANSQQTRAAAGAMAEESHVNNDDWPVLGLLDFEDSAPPPSTSQTQDMAVVAMQGQFPHSPTLEDFWDNLMSGHDAIDEIPTTRWPLDGFFDADTDSRNSGLSYAKWGGFLSDIDQFDARFFGIATREANTMDPQERLFLQCAWHVLEDSGLAGERGDSLRHADGALDIGVFVGATTNTWPLQGPVRWQAGIHEIPAGIPWSIANRVSYGLDLCGPSLTIDTACSSSLVALHNAIESLQKRECRAAIIGGVNLYTHPAKYVHLCQQRMLSPTGRCHSFGAKADGFVPGEGVGALMLRPLADAHQDGDRVLAVIRSTRVNHGGRTNGYTVPSSVSQARLIDAALKQADIEPASISYIEAHGTGTRLGDPLELEGLKQSLDQAQSKEATPACAIGSVKSSIGHLESAAGIAGLIKVILQLQHQQIPPSLHSESLNPELTLEGSRFTIPQQAMPWQSNHTPLRAGVSSFGAGGANAHAIIEQAPTLASSLDAQGPMVFPLSARSSTSLNSMTQALRDWLVQPQATSQDLKRIAYTLQCGRSHFEHRLAVASTQRDELIDALNAAMAGEQHPALFVGRINASAEPTAAAHEHHAPALAEAWCRGADHRWKARWNQQPVPCSLPLYCFEKERHWLTDVTESPQPGPGVAADKRMYFSAEQYFLRDHVIKGQPVLPAAAYIDLMHHMIGQDASGFDLRNLSWAQPVTLGGKERVQLILKQEAAHNGTQLRLCSAEGTVHFQASTRSVSGQANAPVAPASPGELRRLCARAVPTADFYPAFAQRDIHYGPSFQCIERAWRGEGQALTELRWRPEGRDGAPMTSLDPALLDGVFQSALFASASADQQTDAFIPYSLGQLTLHRPFTTRLLVHCEQVRQKDALEVFDFTVMDTDGNRLLTIQDFAFRRYQPQPAETQQSHWLTPTWQSPANALTDEPGLHRQHGAAVTTLLITHNEQTFSPLMGHFPTLWLQLDKPGFCYRDQRVIEADPQNARQVDLVVRLLRDQNRVPEHLILDVCGDSASTDRSDIDLLTSAANALRLFCQQLPDWKGQITVLADTPAAMALAGLLRSLHLEQPAIDARLILLDAPISQSMPQPPAALEWQQVLFEPRRIKGVQILRWHQQEWQQQQLTFEAHHLPVSNATAQSTTHSVTPSNQLQPGDCLLITGGLGALGTLFAKALARQGGLNLVLTGRREADPSSQALLKELVALGAAQADYVSADLCNARDVDNLVQAVTEQHGALHGVIHCAGVLKDDFFVRQDPEHWQQVLSAKIDSTVLLDQATRQQPLRYLVLCSSLAATYGNVGQSAYAVANGWLDQFAEQRQSLVSLGQTSGQTLSIAWPLWQTEEGMQAPEYVRDWLAKQQLSLLPEQQGVDDFLSSLARPVARRVIVHGLRSAVARLFQIDQQAIDLQAKDSASAGRSSAHDQPDRQSDRPVASTGTLETRVLALLTEHLSAVTETPLSRIDPDATLEVFGLDSILVMELNTRLEKHFPELSRTALFEVRSLRELAELIVIEHSDDALKLLPAEEPKAALTTDHVDTSPPDRASETEAPKADSVAQRDELDNDGIAIVGLAGRYPGGSDLDTFWQQLATGQDLVTELPPRWPGHHNHDGLYARWGSFVEDFDCFDPLFFGVSPRDAERMDPQERLFLQSAWHAIEDAGYTPQSLSGPRQLPEQRRRVAVLAGVMYGEYQFYGANQYPNRPDVLTNSSYASIANRVSWCMDLDGPSMALDSMCSSSLTAIHMACNLLRSEDCDAALAGGVNISSHPYKYRMLGDLQFASSEGKCRSFGDGGDGYVPGEGVGVVLLKRLADAIRDGDHIHAVIRGSDLNHGGKTSGYTVPNADAQAQVVSRAFRKASRSPQQLGYIEAHGTGTSLGDPIEIRGLGKALSRQTDAHWHCPIGSVKSNIGHLESAAGMAALTKVLLQLRHQKLAPSIHAEVLNRNIHFDKTPFHVQRSLSDWPAPQQEDGQPAPRLAAISSFGAGGANAHLVIEEWLDHSEQRPAPGAQDSPSLFVWSAASQPQLVTMVQQFLNESGISTDELNSGASRVRRDDFTDVAATLMHGRRHMEQRLAVIAEDWQSLHRQLQKWLSAPATPAVLSAAASHDQAPHSIEEQRRMEEQAQSWMDGNEPEAHPTEWRKVPLPGYDFLKRRYWVSDSQIAALAPASEQPATGTSLEAEIPDSITATPLTPEQILDQVNRKQMTEAQARSLLLAMH